MGRDGRNGRDVRDGGDLGDGRDLGDGKPAVAGRLFGFTMKPRLRLKWTTAVEKLVGVIKKWKAMREGEGGA